MNFSPNQNGNVNPNEARSALDELKKKMKMSKQINQQQQQPQQQQQQYSMNKQPMGMKTNDPYANNEGYGKGNYSNSGYSGNSSNTNFSSGTSGFSSGGKSSKIYAQVPNEEMIEDLPRSPCTICGRMFVLESLAKHTKICKKNATKRQRKKFDMKKKRMIDGEQASLQKYGEMENKKLEIKKAMKKNAIPKWQKQSEEFRRVLKENRKYDDRKS